MKAAFYIVLNLKNGSTFEAFGKFFIGNDRDFAYDIFSRLEGNADVKESDILHMDLVEIVNDLPVDMKVINCTLEQLVGNCRTITKDVFKARTFEDIGL